jgi:putative DNA primase/helicase
MKTLTIDVIRAALDAIPADMPRDEWARIAMALKSELGAGGFEMFDAWSQRGASYDATATRDTWKSVKAGGRVTIGTLIHTAKANGFQWDESASNPPASQEAIKAAAQARAEREARERTERETAQRSAAAEAVRLWNAASESGASPYLVKKAVQGHGVRYAAGGWVLVPMRDAAGELWNVQRIAAEKPAQGPDKLFLKGGRKSGLWHCIGNPAEAPALLICEGYATGASVHEATGHPVIVAFDAGNLANVAREIAKAYRPALVMICGDDDRETEARTGRNSGREKAQAAADKVRGAVVWPEGLPEGSSDFNDMARSVGLDAVRERIETAIAAALQARQSVAGAKRKPPQTVKPDALSAGADSNGNGNTDTAWIDRFSLNNEGVWYNEHDNEGRPKAPLWVCSRLEVPALTRDADGQGWGYLLEFSDPSGHARQWAMPARMLAGDGNEFRGVLMAFGLRIAATSRVRALLAQYIQTRQPEEHARCTDRLGWHGRAFVLPGETLGDAGERIVFQTDGAAEKTLRQRGTLAQWRERVAKLCVGNSRLTFAVSCAFAGPMLRPAAIDSGGFHLRGDSSCGKTTALRVAASVYGDESYVKSWRSTDNALEAIAAQHCDGLLILDEMAQVDSRVVGECSYMLV